MVVLDERVLGLQWEGNAGTVDPLEVGQGNFNQPFTFTWQIFLGRASQRSPNGCKGGSWVSVDDSNYDADDDSGERGQCHHHMHMHHKWCCKQGRGTAVVRNMGKLISIL